MELSTLESKANDNYGEALAEWILATHKLFDSIGIAKSDYAYIISRMMDAIHMKTLLNKINKFNPS